MKIPNPFSNHPHTRFSYRKVVGVVGQCDFIDVEDDAEIVLMEAVNRGRSDADVVYAARIWTSKEGTMGVSTYEQKVKVELEAKQLEKDQKAFNARKRAEAEAKKSAKVAEEYAKRDKEAKEQDKIDMEIEQNMKYGDMLSDDKELEDLIKEEMELGDELEL